MIWIDYAILGVIGLSAAISVVRGFIREALSLAGWIAAFWIAVAFGDAVAAGLEDQISVPSARLALAFLVLFIGTLLVTALVLWFVGVLVEKTGLSGTDRVLGVLFGVGRGAIIVGILVLFAGFTPLPHDPWWTDSVLLPHFVRLAAEIRGFLPPEIAGKVRF